MAHDVFISYSHEDAFVAQAVCAKLEEKQIRCWYAPRNINADDNYSLYKISLSAGTEEQIDQRGFSCLNIVVDCLYLLQPNVGYVRILLK